jgi:hypothetical protein
MRHRTKNVDGNGDDLGSDAVAGEHDDACRSLILCGLVAHRGLGSAEHDAGFLR